MWMEIESFVKVAELLSTVTIFISSEYGTNPQHPPLDHPPYPIDQHLRPLDQHLPLDHPPHPLLHHSRYQKC